MRHHKWAKIICLLIAIGLTKACDYDLTFSPAQTQDIRFSSDTVYLDTIFTSIGSSTYNLRIYNQADHNIKIGSVVQKLSKKNLGVSIKLLDTVYIEPKFTP